MLFHCSHAANRHAPTRCHVTKTIRKEASECQHVPVGASGQSTSKCVRNLSSIKESSDPSFFYEENRTAAAATFRARVPRKVCRQAVRRRKLLPLAYYRLQRARTHTKKKKIHAHLCESESLSQGQKQGLGVINKCVSSSRPRFLVFRLNYVKVSVTAASTKR